MMNKRSFNLKHRAFIPHPSSLIPSLIVGVVLLYGVVYPNLHVIIATLEQGGGVGAGGLTGIFLRRAVLEAAAASVGLSVLTVLLCALVGIPLAFLFERYTFPARRLFATLAALPPASACVGQCVRNDA